MGGRLERRLQRKDRWIIKYGERKGGQKDGQMIRDGGMTDRHG